MELEVTDLAIEKILEKQVEYVRLGVTGGGCAGYEYVFKEDTRPNEDDTVLDYGKWKFVIDSVSIPYLSGMTLDYVYDGLNEFFKFNNPKEESSCGCGISVQFKQ